MISVTDKQAEGPTVEWARLRADEVSARVAANTIVIVPIASVENHGPHLPTGVDAWLGPEIAVRAARRAAHDVPVLVTPPIWSGLAEMHMSLGGTITLDLATFIAMVRSVVRSVVRQGFRRVLLLNSHGGNTAALTAIVNELGSEFNIAIAATSYWQLAAEQMATILEDQAGIEHACEGETSMMLALHPELVDRSKLASAIGPTNPTSAQLVGPNVFRWRAFAARSDHGAIGNPTRASAEKGERLLEAAADAVARLLRHEAFWAQTF